MTREQWDEQQNASKKNYKYVPTGKPGEVKMVEDVDVDGKNIDDKDPEKPLTPQEIRSEWNKFHKWASGRKIYSTDEKGNKIMDENNNPKLEDIIGNEKLNKGDLGNKVFLQYIKEHPEAKIKLEDMPSVRKEMMNVREELFNSIRSGKSLIPDKTGKLVTGKEAEPVLSTLYNRLSENEKSKNPNYIGSLFSTFRFPEQEVSQVVQGKLSDVKSIDDYNKLKVLQETKKQIN